MKCLKRLLIEETAVTSVEYSVMLALIIATAMAAISAFGTETGNLFGDIHTEMEDHGM